MKVERVSRITVLALSTCSTVLIVAWLLKFSSYGLDFSDEGFYLAWISNPFAYDYSYPITNFGFIYHPIFLMLDGNVAALRQFNVLLTFFLAWILAYQQLQSCTPEIDAKPAILHMISAGFAVSSLLVLTTWGWLPTPNYNSLVLQALLLVAIGLSLADKSISKKSMIGWVVIGIGGWLTFMAKPSSALALAVVVPIYLLAARKFSIRFALLAALVAFVLLWLSVKIISGSVPEFMIRLQTGFDFARLLNAGHTVGEILRIDSFSLRTKGWIAIVLIVAITATGAWRSSNPKGVIGLALSAMVAFILVMLFAFGVIRWVPDFRYRELLMLGVLCSAIAVVWAARRSGILKNSSASQWSMVILLLMMPRIASFGTNGNYWHQDGASAIFWVLSAVTLIGPLIKVRGGWLFIMPFVLVVQVLTSFLLNSGMERAYRQPPIWLNQSRLPDVPKVSSLVFFESYAAYIKETATILQSNGFTANAPLIDLSGQSPGLLYAVGAENTGYAWIFGGYPGSKEVARKIFAHTPCEKLAAAWVLREPNGPRSIPDDAVLMTDFGANISEDYMYVGSWNVPEGAGGSWNVPGVAGGYSEPRKQELYRPIAADRVLQACLAKR